MRSIEQPQDFEHYYAQSNLPIVLDCYTDTCNPCKSLMPILDKLSREYESDVVFLKTKANENVVLAKELGVVSVPTLIFVNKDKEIERSRGLVTEHSLRQKIEELLKYKV